MNITTQRNMRDTATLQSALRMFKRNDLSYMPVIVVPLSNDMFHRAQSPKAEQARFGASVATIH